MEKKEESGFGFKDKAKALETLDLLEKESHSYQSLTVRGLLGRAKRTLKLTKDAEKIKNISEAIAVFEEWIEDCKKKNESENKKKETKSRKDGNEDDKNNSKDENSADTVPGLGFKDKEKALETLKLLEGRDFDYQKLAVKGLIGRAKRVLTCTKDKEKVQNINDALKVFEKFLDDFERKNLSKENLSYLPLNVIEACLKLAEQLKAITPNAKAFIKAYQSVDGQYKRLRTTIDDDTKLSWDIVRNKQLNQIRKKLNDPDLFDDDDHPTQEHLQMIVWGYSPQEQRVKKLKLISQSNANKTDTNKDTKMKRKIENDESKHDIPNKKVK